MLYHTQASHCFVRFGLFDLQPFHQPAVLLRRQHLHLNFGPRPLVRSLLQPLVEEDEAIPFPVQPFYSVPLSPTEQKQRIGERVQFKLLLYHRGQTIDPFAQICISTGDVDLVCSGKIVQHCLSSSTRVRSNSGPIS